MAKKLIDKIRDAGVVGAGGAGFPTWKKVDASVEYVVANGAECEPLLHNDQNLMANEAEAVVRGIELTMEATGAREGIIGLKGKYKVAVAAFRRALKKKSHIRLHFFESHYPAGDEFVMVYETTGRVIPEKGLPLEVGVINSNVETFRNIAEADRNRPVIDRYVTVAGAVRNPVTLRVPIGTAFDELISLAGGPTVESYALLVGGIMMGKLSRDASQPVTKTTGAVIVLPDDHPLVRRREIPFTGSLHATREFCCQCNLCTLVCPRYLLGHELYPHLVMRSVLFGLPFPENGGASSAYLCCECELCGLYICPMNLPIARVNANVTRNIAALGWEPQKISGTPVPRLLRDESRIPTPRLVHRLRLAEYDRDAPFSDVKITPARVEIPLKQNVGAPAIACVKVGQRVKKGQVIGMIPRGKLGARHHASIAGIVKELNGSVVIESR